MPGVGNITNRSALQRPIGKLGTKIPEVCNWRIGTLALDARLPGGLPKTVSDEAENEAPGERLRRSLPTNTARRTKCVKIHTFVRRAVFVGRSVGG